MVRNSNICDNWLILSALPVLFVLLTSTQTNAKTTTPPHAPSTKTHELFESLDYPELQVVPLASRRLKLERKSEENNWWHVHWPMQASALSTLVLPFIADGQKKTDLSTADEGDFSTAKTGTMILGASWLTATILIGIRKPYNSGYKEIRAVKGKDKRSRLLRERLAEETLEKQASLIRKLRKASAITNSLAAIYIGSFTESTGKLYAAASAILALLPLWIDDPHIFTYEKHMHYKRNIYAPLTMLKYIPEQTPTGLAIYPSLELAWNF